MTLAVQTPFQIYTGDGSTTGFSIPFAFYANNNYVEVILRDVSVDPPTETAQVYGTHYTISGTTLTMISAPSATKKLYIGRKMTLEQLKDFISSGAFPVEQVEDGLDKLCALIQQIGAVADRSIKFEKSAGQAGAGIGSMVGKAGYLVKVNSGETGLDYAITLADFLANVAAAAASAASASNAANAAAASASSAANQVTLAAAQVTLAQAQVALAEAQVGLAEDQVDLASGYADDASDFADAASDSADEAAASAATAAAGSAYNVNNSLASPGTVAGSGVLSFTAGLPRNKKYFKSTGGAVTGVTIQAGTIDGQELLLRGCSDTDTVLIDFPSGQILFDSKTQATLNWDGSAWDVCGRSN